MSPEAQMPHHFLEHKQIGAHKCYQQYALESPTMPGIME